jgi:hypothetical protein
MAKVQKDEGLIPPPARPVDNVIVIPSGGSELTQHLGKHVPNEQLTKTDTKAVSQDQVVPILNRLAKIKGISLGTAARAVAELFRRGAANAGASSQMGMDIVCPDTGVTTEVTKYDIAMVMQQEVGHQVVRKLAEAMAQDMLIGNLLQVKQNPLLDLKGDLAVKINADLIRRNGTPLTRQEEVCCATYAQWLPNLNELANSNRLKQLLEQDMANRKVRRKKAMRGNAGGGKPEAPAKPKKK